MGGLTVKLQLSRPGFGLDADFVLQPGVVTGLNGASGAGKTTLLRCLTGLQQPDRGLIRLNGSCWLNQETNVCVPAHRRNIGYVAQKNDLFPHLDVAGNLALAGATETPAARELITALGVSELLGRRVGGLSGGQAQRVRIARALLRNADLLLLDEPLNMLDPGARSGLLEVLGEQVRARGQIALLTSHAPEDLAQATAETILLREGRIERQGPTTAVLNDPALAVAAGARAGSLLDCRYSDHPTEYGLRALEITGAQEVGWIWVAAPPRGAGTSVRIYVHARDVSLARSAATDSSIQNILPARVRELRARADALVMVELQLGAQQLHACITGRAQERLQLQPGEPVFVQIKSVSLLG